MSEYQAWTERHYLALLAGDETLLERLRRGGRFAASTPFEYPGRAAVVVYLAASGGRVRLSEEGDLLRFLESQGMDLTVDVVVSKTVWHAAQEAAARLGNGQVYVDCAPEEVPGELASFTQMLLEVVGLRHSKYKDALVQLERGRTFDDPLAAPPRY